MSLRALHIDTGSHEMIFHSLNNMARGFAILAANGNAAFLNRCDDMLAMGWVARMQFTVGSAGALGCSLELVSLDGQVHPILTLDAPPAAKGFAFQEQGAIGPRQDNGKML